MNMPLDLSVASHLILLSDSEEFLVNFLCHLLGIALSNKMQYPDKRKLVALSSKSIFLAYLVVNAFSIFISFCNEYCPLQ